MKSASPEHFFAGLAQDDKSEVTKWQEKRSVILRDRMQKEIEAELECDSTLMRESTPFLRVDVTSYDPRSQEGLSSEEARLTIWQPTDEQVSALKEGTIVQVQNVSVRDTKYDGMVQLTANSRTCILPVAEPQAACALDAMPRKPRLQNLFRLHVLSNTMLKTSVGELSTPAICAIDTVVIALRTIEIFDSGSSKFALYVTDETNLIARIQCDVLPTELIRNMDVVIYLCGLRVLPFDTMEQCAVAQYCAESKLANVSGADTRIEELRRWVSSPLGSSQKHRVQRYLSAKIPIREGGEWRVAIGYVVGLRVIPLSKEKLYVEVDCAHSESIQAWELPHFILGKMLSILSDYRGESDRCAVAFSSEEEVRIAELGVLGPVFHARGVLWHFHLRRTLLSSSEPSLGGDFIVIDANVADTQALANVYEPVS
jgi:hypothetical protein